MSRKPRIKKSTIERYIIGLEKKKRQALKDEKKGRQDLSGIGPKQERREKRRNEK